MERISRPRPRLLSPPIREHAYLSAFKRVRTRSQHGHTLSRTFKHCCTLSQSYTRSERVRVYSNTVTRVLRVFEHGYTCSTGIQTRTNAFEHPCTRSRALERVRAPIQTRSHALGYVRTYPIARSRALERVHTYRRTHSQITTMI